MGTKNKKIEKYRNEIESTRKKIEGLQDHLRSMQAKLKREEELEMIRSLRSTNMQGDPLYDLLNGIRDGSIQFYREGKPIRTGKDKATVNKKTESPEEVKDHEKMEESN